jgi:antitoxin VapB
VFRNGASQAIRLPKEFRFEGREVCVRRIGSAVLLFPKGAAWDLMAQTLGKADSDFLAERHQPARAEHRNRLARAKGKGA